MAHTVNLALVCSKLIGRCLKSVKLQACSINHSLAFLLLYGCHDFSPRHGAAFIFVVLLYFFFPLLPPGPEVSGLPAIKRPLGTLPYGSRPLFLYQGSRHSDDRDYSFWVC